MRNALHYANHCGAGVSFGGIALVCEGGVLFWGIVVGVLCWAGAQYGNLMGQYLNMGSE